MGADTIYTGPRLVEFGVLDGFDGGWIYLNTRDGAMCLMRTGVREIAPIEPPETDPARSLLRPSQAPDDANLVRPVYGPVESDPDLLLRPADPADQE